MFAISKNYILKNVMDETKQASLKSHQVLVLSTGYEPLFRTGWKRAISAVLSGRAEVVENHDSLSIGTPSGKIECPTVVRFITGVIASKIRAGTHHGRPSKKMLWHRDKGLCQYCDKKISISNATIDHVVPKSRGGSHTWDNLVIACSKCNSKKGCDLLEESSLSLKKMPKKPSETFLPLLS